MTSPPPIRADLAHQAARRRRARKAAVLTALGGLVLAAGLVAAWAWGLVFSDLPRTPDKAGLMAWNRPVVMVFLDRSGQELGRRGAGGFDLQLKDMPPYVPLAFLAAEDRRFYRHPGVDLVGVLRAARADLEARRIVEGGSTLTQQIARSLFLTSDRTFKRKLQEAVLALGIERRMSKDEILSLYLNRTYLGAGAYGVEEAARRYFAKPARALTLSEAALIAALPKAPSRLDPTNDLPAALQRSRLVLSRMKAEGWIGEAEEKAALAAPPRLAPEPATESAFGYALDMAAARARELAGGQSGALVVRLSLDAPLQIAAAEAADRAVASGKARGATEAALVLLGPGGAVRALVGGVDHQAGGFNRAVDARRQPGSAFKPFVYAAALEKGMTPETRRSDARGDFDGWSPRNAGDAYLGQISLTDALARSVNTVAARTAREVGPEQVAAVARRFGVKGLPPEPALSIALGAYEVSLLDLTSAFQTFQQGGRRSEPYLIETVADASGRVLYRRAGLEPLQVYDPRLSGQMVAMMRQVIDNPRGTGRAARLDRPAAGKTGTSQAYRDAWFVGFTPDWTLGVWMGDDRARPMDHVGGGELPALLWREVMTRAHEGLPVADFTGDGPPSADNPRSIFYRELEAAFTEAAEGVKAPQ